MLYKIQFVIEYIKRQKRGIFLIAVLTMCGSVMAALAPWPMKILVDYALGDSSIPYWLDALSRQVNGPELPTTLVILAAVFSVVLFAVSSAINACLSLLWSKTGQQMVYQAATDFLELLQHKSLLFHNKRHVGDLLDRLSTDTYCLYTLSEILFVSPLRHFLTIVTIGFVAWSLDPRLTILAVIMTPIMAGSAMFFGSRLRTRALLAREAQSRLASFIHQTLSVIPLVQAFGSVPRNQGRFKVLAQTVVNRSQHSVLESEFYAAINGLVTTCGMALVLFYGSSRVLSGAATVGSLLVFVAYVGPLQNAFRGLFGIYGQFKEAEANLDRLLELSNNTQTIVDSPNALEVPPASRTSRAITFEDVSFSYEPGRAVLREINLHVNPGEMIALVGSTGSGKSTISYLIQRFFDPSKGRLLMDGVDIKKFKISSLRDQISGVFQETYLMPVTIAENISYGCIGASREAIADAASAAGIDKFVQSLPNGYDTVLSEGGANLSGGQRQRISIARALLRDSPVLILDEPTSAIDAETESQILEALDHLTLNRTTIVIAHRLSTIKKADRIYLIEKGKIVESGNYRSLIEKKGSFYRLHKSGDYTPTEKATTQQLQLVVPASSDSNLMGINPTAANGRIQPEGAT